MFEGSHTENGWPIVNLVDQLEQIIDNRGKTPPKSETGIPALSAKSVKIGDIDYSKVYFVSEDTYKKFMVRGLPKVGDVLLTTEAPLGCVARLDRDDVCLAQRLITLRGKAGVLDNDYLRFYLSSTLGQHELISRASGSTVQGIKRSEFCKIDIVLPPYQKQLDIASKIRAIEEKITLNRQTNQTLEHIAQAIFKSWFVDFDPTRAKIAAKENSQAPELAAMAAIAGKEVEELKALSADQIEKLKSTAALFPDGLADSKLGEIPEGWIIGSVGDIALAKGGYAFKGKSFVDEGHPVVKIKNITGDGRVDLTGAVCINDEQASSSKRFKLNDGDLLMAMTGATVGKIGFVTTGGKAVYLNQRVAKFESEKFGRKISWFLFCCFGRSSIFDSVVGAAQGSAQPNISSSGIEATQLVMPSHELIEEFSNKCDSLFRKWLCNIDENAGLEQLRDTILPKLLSGELTTHADTAELEASA